LQGIERWLTSADHAPFWLVTLGSELALDLSVKATLAHRRLAEVPTTWRDRTAGKSNFNLRRWFPHCLRWFFVAIRGRFRVRRHSRTEAR
jgi:hypothetical protein